MPHQCVKCGILYEDGATEILKGCSCTGRMFFYVKKEKLAEMEKTKNLSKKDKEQIESDVYDIIGDEIDRESSIVLDIESIKILKPGKYHLDLVNLFKKKQPLIYQLEDGKYMIDLIETFKKLGEKDEE